jgi:hypothetical protein
MHMGNLVLYRIERRLFRARRDAEAGVNNFNPCLRYTVGTACKCQRCVMLRLVSMTSTVACGTR